MFEKVNPKHPDKLCDTIAGALVDMAYSKEKNPRIAVEVVTALGDYGADVNSILKCNDSGIKEEKGNDDKLSEQLETIISLLKTLVDIWGGNKE